MIVISSEMPELLGMCDRIYVMNEGRFVDEMPAEEASQEKIMASSCASRERHTDGRQATANHAPGRRRGAAFWKNYLRDYGLLLSLLVIMASSSS